MGGTRVVHIEPKVRRPSADAAVLERALAAHVGRDLLPADASALSGLPLDAAEPALLELARRYPCRIRVTAGGQLVFRFASLARPRGPSPLTRTLAALRAVAERVVATLTIILGPALLVVLVHDVVALGSATRDTGWFFLAVIPCMAVGAFAALGALLTFLYFIVFPFAGLASLVGGVVILVMLAVEGAPHGGAGGLAVLALIMLAMGYPFAKGGIRIWRDAVFRRPTWAHKLWRGAIELLLGPPAPPRPDDADGLADERELVALIRAKKGILVTADLVDLFGWTPAEADAELARILCDYGGDVAVTEAGAIVYAFTDPRAVSGPGTVTGSLLATAGVEVPPPTRAGPPPPVRFFADRGGAVVVLVALGIGALGVLVHPATVLFPGPREVLTPFPELTTKSGPVTLPGLGLWPHVFVFGALALRWPLWWRRSRRVAARARLAPYLAIAGQRPGGDRLPPEAGPVDVRTLAALGGDLDDRGRVSFPELARDLAAAGALRAARPDARRPLDLAP